jgi:hypothetical protein
MIATELDTPSTLADVLRQVVQAFDLAYERKIPIQIGGHYKESFGQGGGPKVLFVPEARGGKIASSIQMGNACSYVHAVDVYVRGEDSADDVARFDQAYKLADCVLGAITVAATGRLEFGPVGDDSPTRSPAYGAGIAFSFTYQRDVPHWDRRWALTFGGPSVGADGATINPTVTPQPE